jgi:catechol O-methyltransferase
MATSTDFDQTKAYAQQEDVYFNDGREKNLLEYVVSLPHLEEVKGSPSAVLAAIDEFGRNEKYLMNVGENKGSIITNLISQKKPEIMVRLPLLR